MKRLYRQGTSRAEGITLALAFGIGSSAVLFSVTYNLVFTTFGHYKNPNRLAVTSVRDLEQAGDDNSWFSIPEVVYLREHNRVYEDMVGSYQADVLFSDGGGTRYALGAFSTTNAFDFFGTRPFLGGVVFRRCY